VDACRPGRPTGPPEASPSLRAISVLLYRPLQTPDAAGQAENGYRQLQALTCEDRTVEGADGLLIAAAQGYAAEQGA
jgi:hypothetical protein